MTNTRRAVSILLLAAAVSLVCSAAALALDKHTCSTCGRVIQGHYFETGGRYFHPACFTCGYCKKTIDGGFTVFRGKNYHTPCFEKHVALRCAVCDGIIQGQYLLDHWGNAYHTHHKDSVVQCDFCERFIVGALARGMVRLPDGRSLCSKCETTSITTTREGRSVLLEAARRLQSLGIDVDAKRIEFHLVGKGELASITGNNSQETKGFTDYFVERGPFGKVHEETIKVYLLYGMPRAQMTGTAAHELMHVWQFQRGHLDQERALSEGSCNFASYLVLRKVGGPEAEFIIDAMLKDPDRTYGQGFRTVKAYAEENGISAWLHVLKEKHPDLSTR